jgi:hypothetical protein
LKRMQTRYYLYLPEPLFARIGGVEKCLASIPAGGQYAIIGRREP